MFYLNLKPNTGQRNTAKVPSTVFIINKFKSLKKNQNDDDDNDDLDLYGGENRKKKLIFSKSSRFMS